MANHKSAVKRSRQTIKKNKINQIISSQVKTNFKRLIDDLHANNPEAASESLKSYNSSLSKAVNRRIIKKKHASRKLSSLLNKLNKIA